jgi:DNA-binding winged helix-turn-helix (wHTH) protein
MAEWRFDRFIIQPERRRLLIDGESAKVGARAFDVLVALIERRQRVVGKTELLDLVWPNAAVEEGNLQVQVFALRQLLGAAAIATIPGRGYQFAASIDGDEPAAAAARRHAATAGTSERPGNLPLHLPPLYGRDADTAALRALIAENRLVTVAGPGGIGKTRVAQAVAHQLTKPGRGAWLIELAPITKAELTVSTVARAPSGLEGKRSRFADRRDIRTRTAAGS